MTKAGDSRKKRRVVKPSPDQQPVTQAEPQPGLTAEQQVTILAQQVGFARSHFFALVQRHAASKVESQALQWDAAAELINREMQNLDAQLNAIAQQAQG